MDQVKEFIIISSKDNVATSLTELKSGSVTNIRIGSKVLTIKLTSDVPFGHKFSLTEMKCGDPVIKYGEIIGTATQSIHPGDYVHIHNVASTRGSKQIV